MSREDLLRSFPWHRYSKKMAGKIERPRCMGHSTAEDARNRGMHYSEGESGSFEEGNYVRLYWLVDPSDGVIVDSRFQVFGQSALIAAAEAACEIVVGKNHDQARRLSADLIDKHLRDRSDIEAFPEETRGHLNLVLEAIEIAVEGCSMLPLSAHYVSPVPRDLADKESGGFPGWLDLTREKKIAVIEEILNEEVRPYIELDEGGIEILEYKEEAQELVIGYQGTCTSCFSSIGSTLATIQQIVQSKIHPDLKVIPDLEKLKF